MWCWCELGGVGRDLEKDRLDVSGAERIRDGGWERSQLPLTYTPSENLKQNPGVLSLGLIFQLSASSYEKV